MKSIPVDPALTVVFVAVAPHMREGLPATNADGEVLVKVSGVIPPEDGTARVETIEVVVPGSAVPKTLAPFSPIRFEGLRARSWSMEGRSGVSFSAHAIQQPAAPAPKAAG